MGNVKITVLPKGESQIKEFTYSDIKLDLNTSYTTINEFAADSEKKDVEISYDLAAIKNSIVNIFTTAPGEKILNPTFGLDLREYLFEPISDQVADRISNQIYSGLIRQEPRISLEQIPEVIPDFDNQSYTINLVVSIPLLSINSVLFSGLLDFNGFYVLNM
jgi:phage baseplate assembly protein W